jgi:Putative lumazine-binding
MKYFFILLTVLLCGNNGKAQTAEDSVKTVINSLFTGMKNADTAMMKKCFGDSMILQTISRSMDGKLVVMNEKPAAFLSIIGKEQPGNADERITFETIKIDGPLAIAWTPYHFYYKGKFSHCGVNSFQLVRFNGEWKIQYLIDTRRRQGCNVE